MLGDYLNRVYWAADRDNRRAILAALPAAGGGRLLDLGCGDGRFTAQLSHRLGARGAHGIERVPELAAQAAERGVLVERADLTETFPYPDGHFDVVHANQVIEHVPFTDHFLRETHRVVRPGGTVILSTNNLASWHNIVGLIFGWQPPPAHVSGEIVVGNPISPYHLTRFPDPGQSHLRLFTGRALRELAEYHGLRVRTVKGVGYYPLPTRPAELLARLDGRHAAYLLLVATRDRA